MNTKNSILKKRNGATGLAWKSKKKAAERRSCRENDVGAPRSMCPSNQWQSCSQGCRFPFAGRRVTRVFSRDASRPANQTRSCSGPWVMS